MPASNFSVVSEKPKLKEHSSITSKLNAVCKVVSAAVNKGNENYIDQLAILVQVHAHII